MTRVSGHKAGDGMSRLAPQRIARKLLRLFRAVTGPGRGLQTMVDGLPIGVLVHRNGRILYANTAAARLFGYADGVALQHGVEVTTLAITADAPRLRAIVKSQPGTAPNLERFVFRGHGRKGRPQWVEVEARPVRWQLRPAWQWTLHDVTSHRESEQWRSQLATAVEQAADGIFITDVNGYIEYANPAFLALAGRTWDEVVGRTPAFLKSGQHDADYYRRMWEAIQRGEVWRDEYTNRRSNGEVFHTHQAISPLRDEFGTITHFVAVQNDVTEKVKLQEQLVHSQRLEALGTLAGGISHDFNNLLMPILGLTEVRLEEATSEVERRDLTDILRAAERARDLVRQILLFSRRADTPHSPVHLGPMVKELARLLQATLPKSIRVVVDVAPQVPPVHGNSAQLHQVLMNLCVNAGHAMPHGGELTLTMVPEALHEHPVHLGERISGHFLRISVKDTGHGMDEATQARMFEPFFTTKDEHQGTGLGLSTVLGIVQAHEGYLSVHSQPGEGTCFNAYFPVSQPSANDATAATARQGGTETLLVVDDERSVGQVLQVTLERLGYTVHLATTEAEAMAALGQGTTFDLVLLDYMLPDTDGIQLAIRIQRMRHRLPIVLVTGTTMVPDRATLEQAGIRATLYKPVGLSELSATIRRALDGPNKSGPRISADTANAHTGPNGN